MAFVLALGLMPLPAYAAPSDGGGSTDIVAGKSPALTTQGSEQTVGATDEVQAAEWIADLSDTEISTATFFRESDADKNPIRSLTYEGTELQEGTDYRVRYSKFMGGDDGGGYSWIDVDTMPTELGDYMGYVEEVTDDEGNVISAYTGSAHWFYYSIMPDSYAGDITWDNVTLNGQSLEEFRDTTQHPNDDGLYTIDSKIVVDDGTELVEGKDYEIVVNDGNPMTVNTNYYLKIFDLRDPTTLSGKDGIEVRFDFKPAVDVSKCTPWRQWAFEYNDGNPIYIYEIALRDEYGNVQYADVGDDVSIVIRDSYGQEVSELTEIGTYTMEVTGQGLVPWNDFFVNSNTFTFEVKPGKNLVN